MKKAAFFLGCYSAIIYMMVTIKGHPLGTNDASYLATIDSLVHRQTFCIDKSKYKTIDKIYLDGRYVSSKTRIFPVMLSGLYLLMSKLGVNFYYEEALAIKLLTLCASTIPFMLTCFAVYRLLVLWKVDPIVSCITIAAFSWSSMNFVYSGTITNHVFGSALVAWAILVFLQLFGKPFLPIPPNSARFRTSCILGFLTAMGVAVDPLAILVSFGIFSIAMVLGDARSRAGFVVGALPPFLAYVVIQIHGTGFLIPTYDQSLAMLGPTSYWRNPMGIDAVKDPVAIRLANNLIGHHGLFLTSPFLLASLLGLFVWRKLKWSVPFFGIAVATASTFAMIVLIGPCYGGVCFGPRYFIVSIPFCYAVCAKVLNCLERKWALAVGLLLFILSAVIAVPYVSNPWDFVRLSWSYRQLGIDSLSPP